MRSYCSAASQEEERNTVMSFLSAVQSTGFILGPGMHVYHRYPCTCYLLLSSALGLLFQPLGEDGYEWDAIKLHFNLYTGPGFLGILLCIINIMLLVFFFKEFNVHGTKTKVTFIDLYDCCQDNRNMMNKRE